MTFRLGIRHLLAAGLLAWLPDAALSAPPALQQPGQASRPQKAAPKRKAAPVQRVRAAAPPVEYVEDAGEIEYEEQVSYEETVYEPMEEGEVFYDDAPAKRYCVSAPINLLGHLDAQNRLNIFNNYSAQPITHAWYGFAFAADYSVGEIQDSAALGLTTEEGELPNQVRNRVGFELAVSRNFSVAFQGEHINVTDAEILADSWANPQVSFKRVFYRDKRNIISGVVAMTFEGNVQPQESRECFNSIYPGLIWHHSFGERFFNTGFQFGLPTGSAGVDTITYMLGYGRFLYRDPCRSRYSQLYGGYGAGSCGPCCDGDECDSCGANAYRCGFFGWLRREVGLPIHTVAWQIEGYGKGVLGDRQYEMPVGDSDLLNTPSLTINEQQHTFDITTGVTVLYGKGRGANCAASVPVTGDEVYSVAFLASWWKNF
jgi:hypothetical protein